MAEQRIGTRGDLLLVEDDEDVASALETLLTFEGYVVRTARNGAEGLALLGQRLPDAIVLDVEMPVLDGPGMAARMLVRDAGMERIPVILVSGAADLGEVARRIGTPYALQKPCDVETLLASVARAISERRVPQPRAA
jgi:DNA-binding NtrC family response regulator